MIPHNQKDPNGTCEGTTDDLPIFNNGSFQVDGFEGVVGDGRLKPGQDGGDVRVRGKTGPDRIQLGQVGGHSLCTCRQTSEK